MHHLIKTMNLSLMSILLVSFAAHAEPDEVAQQTLTRTTSSGLSLQTKLSQNAYRQEPYQAHYTVQVPYQDTETYYVDVPYQEQEAYTDYETTYTNDYVCQNVTGYEQQCHIEHQCGYSAAVKIDPSILRPREPGTGPAPFPGGGGSDPGPAPFPQPAPRPPTCTDRQVCQNVPVTRQQCGYQQTAHQTPVTRYRTVTKYRQEAHTRPVTKYRDEDRCCVTKYNDVFDHQWGVQVQIQFPQGSELVANEQESFNVEIAGTEAAPDVKVTPGNTVFGYQILSKTVNKGIATVVLKLAPRYKADDLKQSTLQSLQVVPSTKGLTYKFLDNAQYPRVMSTYQLVVVAAGTTDVVAQSAVLPSTQREQSGSLDIAWDYTRNYEVVLKMHRSGVVIDAGVVDFEVRQPLQMQVDMVALKDEKRITSNLLGNGSAAQLKFKDATVPYANVTTKYAITLVRKNFLGKTVAISEKSFSRTSLTAGSDGNYTIAIKDLGVSDSDIKSYVKSGSKVEVVIEVDRLTASGDKIQFWASAWIDVK